MFDVAPCTDGVLRVEKLVEMVDVIEVSKLIPFITN